MSSTSQKIISLALAILLVGCSAPSRWQHTLNSFQLKTLQGDPVDLSAYKGKTVFLNVWATWCKPCIQEMPSIAAAMTKLSDRDDIVFLLASSEEPEDIVRFQNRKSFPFTYVQLLNLEALEIRAIPATFIFDSSGEMVFGEEGFRDWSTTENLNLITQIPD